MKISKLHSVSVIFVLWCYFLALTPLHAFWHLLEDTFHTETSFSVEKKSAITLSDCSFCDVVLNQQNGHFITSEIHLELPFFLPISSEENFFYSNEIGFLVIENPMLRAPPIC